MEDLDDLFVTTRLLAQNVQGDGQKIKWSEKEVVALYELGTVCWAWSVGRGQLGRVTGWPLFLY